MNIQAFLAGAEGRNGRRELRDGEPVISRPNAPLTSQPSCRRKTALIERVWPQAEESEACESDQRYRPGLRLGHWRNQEIRIKLVEGGRQQQIRRRRGGSRRQARLPP
jgi:hypothetical protein